MNNHRTKVHKPDISHPTQASAHLTYYRATLALTCSSSDHCTNFNKRDILDCVYSWVGGKGTLLVQIHSY